MKTSRVLFILTGLLLLSSCLQKPKTYEYQNFNPLTDNTGTISEDEVPLLPAPPGSSPVTEDPKKKKDLDKSATQDVPAESADELADLKSLNFMLDILFDYSIGIPSKNVELLEKFLEASNLSPSVATESNPFTGSLTLVRNFKNLRGTRYFLAQYTGDDQDTKPKDFELEHMSFEFRPGPKSLAFAKNAVQKRNPLNGKPYIERENLIAWQLMRGYHVYVMVLSEDDIDHNPYNVYFPSDVGTIKIAIEKDPHVLGDFSEEDYGGDDEYVEE